MLIAERTHHVSLPQRWLLSVKLLGTHSTFNSFHEAMKPERDMVPMSSSTIQRISQSWLCQKPNVNVAKAHTCPSLEPAHEARVMIKLMISVGTRERYESGNNTC